MDPVTGMEAQSIFAVGGAVVTLTQFAKWAKLPDRFGPIAVLVLAAMGVAFWGWTHGGISQANAFDYFTGWITVSTSAAGVYGFTRASSEALTKMQPPPGGAGSSATRMEIGGDEDTKKMFDKQE